VFSKHKVRRIPILDEQTGQLSGIVTRTDLMRWFEANAEHFTELVWTPLQNLPGLQKPVVTFPLHATAFDAFYAMNEKNLSAVGVVDALGKICASIRLDDFHRVEGSISQRLPLTLAPYCTAAEFKKYYILSKLGTFGGAVKMLRDIDDRRLYIFEPEENVPCGVLSQLDVIEQIHRYRMAVLQKTGPAAATAGAAAH